MSFVAKNDPELRSTSDALEWPARPRLPAGSYPVPECSLTLSPCPMHGRPSRRGPEGSWRGCNLGSRWLPPPVQQGDGEGLARERQCRQRWELCWGSRLAVWSLEGRRLCEEKAWSCYSAKQGAGGQEKGGRQTVGRLGRSSRGRISLDRCESQVPRGHLWRRLVGTGIWGSS